MILSLPRMSGSEARSPLCRPAGWICLWRRLGNCSVLNRRAGA